MGKLYHDLHSSNKGLPPNTRMQIELSRTSDDLFLEKFHATGSSPSTTQFKVSISDIKCYIPVSCLSEPVCRGKKT